jgi:hypothetical protein
MLRSKRLRQKRSLIGGEERRVCSAGGLVSTGRDYQTVGRWRDASQGARAQLLLKMSDQKDLQMRQRDE